MIEAFALLALGVSFIAMVSVMRLGRRFGKHRIARDPEGWASGTAPIEGAVFALMTLLVAFTFSGAATRFAARRQLLVEEANAKSSGAEPSVAAAQGKACIDTAPAAHGRDPSRFGLMVTGGGALRNGALAAVVGGVFRLSESVLPGWRLNAIPGLAIPIPRTKSTLFAYPQYRVTIGVQFGG